MSEKIDPEILKEAEKKVGISSEEIKKAASGGDISGIIKNLDKNSAEKVKKVLSDKDSAMKILSTPQAKALLKKFFGGK